MAYRPRPFGLGPYGDDLYSQYRQPEIAIGLIGRAQTSFPLFLSRDVNYLADARGVSRTHGRLFEDAVVHAGALAGRSHISATLRFYWEENLPCDTTWTVQPPPPYVCTELVHG